MRPRREDSALGELPACRAGPPVSPESVFGAQAAAEQARRGPPVGVLQRTFVPGFHGRDSDMGPSTSLPPLDACGTLSSGCGPVPKICAVTRAGRAGRIGKRGLQATRSYLFCFAGKGHIRRTLAARLGAGEQEAGWKLSGAVGASGRATRTGP